MESWVEIKFDCLPLRCVVGFEIPDEASPKFRARCENLLRAVRKHGAYNAFYLYNASCRFHLTNRADLGMLTFDFEGTVLTNESDERTASADLRVELAQETCDWLNQPIVEWFGESTRRAVMVEFDRYIAAGDLAKTIERLEKARADCESQGGFVGMGL